MSDRDRVAQPRVAEDPLRREKRFLLANIESLAVAHPGKYLLIQGDAVHGAFETFEAGVTAGLGMFPATAFLVRSVLQPEDPEPINIPVLSLGIPISADPQH